jgi:hypothetical protein
MTVLLTSIKPVSIDLFKAVRFWLAVVLGASLEVSVTLRSGSVPFVRVCLLDRRRNSKSVLELIFYCL